MRIPIPDNDEPPSFYDPEAEKIKVLICEPVFSYSKNKDGEKILKHGEIPRENKEEYWGTTGTNFKLQNTDQRDRKIMMCYIRSRHLSHRIWARRDHITPNWMMNQAEQKISDITSLNRTKNGETWTGVTTQQIHQKYEEGRTMLTNTLSKVKEGFRRI